MNKTQAARMLTMAAFVEKLPRHNLDQLRYVCLNDGEAISDLLNPQCSSSCCTLGWTAILDQKNWRLDMTAWGAVLVTYRKSGMNAFSGARKYFGISIDEVEKLFGSTLRTPARQASMMRKIAAKHGWEEA